MKNNLLPSEGDIYKIINVEGMTFTITYGYYSEIERETGATVPILPDFEATPLYNASGRPYVTHIQDACSSYSPRNGEGDGWCADCIHYPDDADEIGVCRCESKKMTLI